MSTFYCSWFPFQYPCTFISFRPWPSYKREKAELSAKTGLAVFILLHISILILIILLTLVSTHLENTPNNRYKTCSDRKATRARKLLLERVQFQYIFSARSCNLVKLLDLICQIILLRLKLPAPKYTYISSGWSTLYHQHYTLDERAKARFTTYLLEISPAYTASTDIVDCQCSLKPPF